MLLLQAMRNHYGTFRRIVFAFSSAAALHKLNSIKTLGDQLVDGLRTLLPFRNRPGPRRSMLHSAGDHNRRASRPSAGFKVAAIGERSEKQQIGVSLIRPAQKRNLAGLKPFSGRS